MQVFADIKVGTHLLQCKLPIWHSHVEDVSLDDTASSCTTPYHQKILMQHSMYVLSAQLGLGNRLRPIASLKILKCRMISARRRLCSSKKKLIWRISCTVYSLRVLIQKSGINIDFCVPPSGFVPKYSPLKHVS